MDFQAKSLGQDWVSPRKYFNPEAFNHRRWSSHTDYSWQRTWLPATLLFDGWSLHVWTGLAAGAGTAGLMLP